MRYLVITAILLTISACFLLYKSIKRSNRVQSFYIKSEALKNHPLGESDNRNIKVYLPPGYYDSDKRYPCIYFLHGFTTSNKQFDDWEFKKACDAAIQTGKIGEFILVMPDSDNEFMGSFYGGVWAQYICEDVVPKIDSLFRTIPDIKSRGIAGHSMGGNGALKLPLKYPNLFGSIYSMSPSVLDWDMDFTFDNPSFKLANTAKDKEDIFNDFYASVIIAMGRAYSPNSNSKHFGADLPVVYKGIEKSIDSNVLALWESEFPLKMFKKDKSAYKNVSFIKIDWGKQDPYTHIGSTCEQFCALLEKRKIEHECGSYDGDHANAVPGINGKIGNEMMIFFNKSLNFN
jgi:pimeloyl-ACP methyl ester carboxylesterase